MTLTKPAAFACRARRDHRRLGRPQRDRSRGAQGRRARQTGRLARRARGRVAPSLAAPCSTPTRRTLTLELGCGHGHFLDDYAKAHPEEFCIGIDLRSRRVDKSNRKRDRGGHDNLAFMKAEASEFLDALPDDARLAKIFFLFPDPWPKKRHFRYRMIRPDMLDRLAKRAPEGARLHFRSDHTGVALSGRSST